MPIPGSDAGVDLAVVSSAKESARFGLAIGRLRSERVSGNRGPVTAAIEASQQDLVIVRYPSADTSLAFHLAVPGYTAWQADTLLYFDKDVTGPYPPAPESDAVLVHLGPVDRSRVEQAVRDTFDGYHNHYSSNPALDPRASLEGYLEWASDHLSTPGRGALGLVQATTGGTIGICTVHEGESAEITLAGIVPHWRGSGWYSVLLDRVERWLADRGATSVTISTQAGNRTGIRRWIAAGYQYCGALNTMHVMRSDLCTRRTTWDHNASSRSQ